MIDKLELMQRIYEISKVEPDYYYRHIGSSIPTEYVIKPFNKKSFNELVESCTAYMTPFPTVYYPLEQVLRELSNHILVKRRSCSYLLDLNKLEYKNVSCRGMGKPLYSVSRGSDYHLAALELWLKVLENNK